MLKTEQRYFPLLIAVLLLIPLTIRSQYYTKSEDAAHALSDSTKYIPYIKGNWKILFQPTHAGTASYINDHTVIKHTDNTWHMIGITPKSSGAGGPTHERQFAHASGPDLFTQDGLNEHDLVIDYGRRCWAPHSIYNSGKTHLFYTSFVDDKDSKVVMVQDSSEDLFDWSNTFNGVEPATAALDPGKLFRDGMVLFDKKENRWLLYATGIGSSEFGTIDVFESADFKTWNRLPKPALVTSGSAIKVYWSAAESPFVIEYNGWYYLFLTLTTSSNSNYQNTLVFRSDNLVDFGEYDGTNGENFVTRIAVHAGEVIYDDVNNEWYITSCGWRNSSTVIDGAVSIARLGWYKEGDPVPDELQGKLEAHWSFDNKDKPGYDDSGNNQQAIVHNAAWTADGKSGGAFEFDDDGDWIDIPDYQFKNDFTIAAWVRLTGKIDNKDGLFGKGTPGQDINFYQGKVRINAGNDTAPWDAVISDKSTVADQWTHLAFVRKDADGKGGDDLTIYMDGKKHGNGDWVGVLTLNTIGWGHLGPGLQGTVDDVYLYSRALDQLEIKALIDSVTQIESPGKPAENYHLNQNYPNPFNPSTTINYSIPKAEFVEIGVYNINGQKVQTLVADQKQAGRYTLNFNAQQYASGVYFCHIHAGRFSKVKKMILLR